MLSVMYWDMYPCVLVRAAGFRLFFFFNDTATTEIYTLSLHDALPISPHGTIMFCDLGRRASISSRRCRFRFLRIDRKSTRLNSSHLVISYAVFCLKKKKRPIHETRTRERTRQGARVMPRLA